MNSSGPSRQPGVLNRPVKMPARRTLWLAAASVALAAAGFGLWTCITQSPPAWLVRWRLDRYIKKHADTGDFKVNFPFPSRSEMSKALRRRGSTPAPTTGPRTGKDFEALREEYFPLKSAALALERDLERSTAALRDVTVRIETLTRQLANVQADATTNAAPLQSNLAELRARADALQKKADSRPELLAKETALDPIVDDLWALQKGFQAEADASGVTSASELAAARSKFTDELREQFRKAGSYSDMYRLIGRELWVARRLLASASPDHRRAGITLAFDACRHAVSDAQNGWVAARICEGFILPHRDLADDPNRRSSFYPENFLNQCVDIFRDNQEFNNVVKTYKSYLTVAGTPQRADWTRSRLSMAYEQAGDPKEALHYLREIRDTNEYRWNLRRAPRLEQQVKNR
jgi:hypothetical protein